MKAHMSRLYDRPPKQLAKQLQATDPEVRRRSWRSAILSRRMLSTQRRGMLGRTCRVRSNWKSVTCEDAPSDQAISTNV